MFAKDARYYSGELQWISMAAGRNILFVASRHSLSKTRRWVLEHAGYRVQRAETATEINQALQRNTVDLVLVGWTDKKATAEQVVSLVRKISPRIPIVSMTGHGTACDAIVLPLAGPEGLLRVVGETLVKAHGHRVSKNERVLFVDQDRRYFHVSDAAAELLGYEREELLGRKIDDITAPEVDVPGKFAAYVRDGVQNGIISLRHKTGGVVTVRYAARVLEDGCMVSRLTRVYNNAA
jgi:PAS domain S-box-containing protein